MSAPVVLDSSALIAFLYEEKGCDVVEYYLPNVVISAVNLSEVASYMVRNGMPMEDVREMLQDISIQVIAYDEEQAFLTAKILPEVSHKGLSLGDRACLALAIVQKLPVLTADKVWKLLDVGVEINLIR